MAVKRKQPGPDFDYSEAIDELVGKAMEIAAREGLNEEEISSLAVTVLMGAYARTNIRKYDGLTDRQLVSFAQYASDSIVTTLAFENARHHGLKPRRRH